MSSPPSEPSARIVVALAVLSVLAAFVIFWASQPAATPPTPASTSAAQAPAAQPEPVATWMSLFDGQSLAGWEITNFGGEGDVHVENGALVLEQGSDLTGVHTHRELPKIDYEVELDAIRVDGIDFFCGLTFPVGDDPCSLIIGGWSGGVCGLSSLDGADASENETTTYKQFENGKWYRIRLRVEQHRIRAWIDDEEILDVDTTGRKLSIRIEVEASRPFGIASWQTTAALRDIRIRELSAAELAAG